MRYQVFYTIKVLKNKIRLKNSYNLEFEKMNFSSGITLRF